MKRHDPHLAAIQQRRSLAKARRCKVKARNAERTASFKFVDTLMLKPGIATVWRHYMRKSGQAIREMFRGKYDGT